MIPIVTPDEMRAVDAAAPEPSAVLVARVFNFAPSAMLQATESPAERQAVRIQM